MRYREALAELRSAQKPTRGVSFYSRLVNRPIGRVLAAAAASMDLSPNLVSIASALVTVAGLIVLVCAEPSPVIGVLVASLLVFGFALDSADGQVARLTHRSSPAGEWLDHVLDAGKMVAVHGAVLVAAFRFETVAIGWLWVPLLYSLVSVVLFAGLTLFTLLRRGAPSELDSSPSNLRALLLLPADYGILSLVFAFWGSPAIFFALYFALFACTTVITGLLISKWFRTLHRTA